MKYSSFFFFTLVLVAFAAIQGWVLLRKFAAPRVFTADEAVFMGETLDVRSPIQGVILDVLAREDSPVEQGEELFVIRRVVTDGISQQKWEEDITLTALRAGVVTDIDAVVGMLAQNDQKLASIVDNSTEALYVDADLNVRPEDVTRIRPLLPAFIQAEYLNGGNTVQAVVSAVDPVYDTRRQTLSVRLRLTESFPELENVALGLPVGASVSVEREPNENLVLVLLNQFFPSSEAENE